MDQGRESLSAVHAAAVRRIARRVQRSRGAGRYFAVGRTPAVRAAVADALAAELGGAAHVKRFHWSGAGEGPWNELRAALLREPLPARSITLLEGVSAAPSGLASLNLARDAWSAVGAHVLVWLDTVADFERLTVEARDLWAYRDETAWFLGPGDFEFPPDFESALRAEAELAITRSEAAVARAKPGSLSELFERLELVRVLKDANEWLRAEREARRLSDDAAALEPRSRALLAQPLARVLMLLERSEQAVVRQLRADAATAAVHRAEAANWRGDSAVVVAYDEAIAACTREDPARVLAIRKNRDLAMASLGRGDGETVEGRAERGELVAALAASLAEMDSHRAAGRFRQSRAVYEQAAKLADSLGFALPDVHDIGDAAARIDHACWVWQRQWARSRAHPHAIVSLVSTLDAGERGRARAAHALLGLAEDLREMVDEWGPELAALEDATRVLHEHARHAADGEAEWPARWALSLFAAMRGDLARARELVAERLVRSVKRHLGPGWVARAFVYLAGIAARPDEALKYAVRAEKLASASPSLFVRLAATRARAVALRWGGSDEAAERLVHDTIRAARTARLRLTELELLHSAAEFESPLAQDSARAALDAALEMLLPREEARARARLAVFYGAGRRAEAELARATEIVEELGPPRLRRRVAESRAALRMPPTHHDT